MNRAAAAGGYTVAFVALFLLAVWTPTGQLLDASSLSAFPLLRSEGWMRLYGSRGLVAIGLLLFAGLAVGWAMLAGRIGDGLRGALLLVVTAQASSWLDSALVRPDLGDFAYPYNTFPSGHTAISLAAVVTIVWALRPSRSMEWLLVASVLFVGAASLLSFAHRASDIVGATLLTGVLVSVVALISSRYGRRVAADSKSLRVARNLLALALGLLVVAFVLADSSSAEAAAAALVALASLLGLAGISILIVRQERRAQISVL